jgi:hypothetical protein
MGQHLADGQIYFIKELLADPGCPLAIKDGGFTSSSSARGW